MDAIARVRHAGLPLLAATLIAGALAGTGCRSAYYHSMEMIGKDKRELLAEGVSAVRDSQREAMTEFESALDRFSAVVGFQGGELEALYERLNEAFERSEQKAAQVHRQVDNVEDVARALFEEWEEELDLYTDQRLRAASERQLRNTRLRYDELVASMHRVERQMDPVLDTFRDQVLFLKHNLNAQAIGSLDDTEASLRREVEDLIDEMEQAINEAERFIEQVQAEA
jgi:hypothetical protein